MATKKPRTVNPKAEGKGSKQTKGKARLQGRRDGGYRKGRKRPTTTAKLLEHYRSHTMSRRRAKSKAEVLRAERMQVVSVNILNGHTYRSIAAQLGVSAQTVFRDVNRLKELWRLEHVSTVQDLIAVESARLDTILRNLMPRVRQSPPDLGAVKYVLEVLDRRLKLYGLDHKAALDAIKEIIERAGSAGSSEALGLQLGNIADGLRELEALARSADSRGVGDEAEGGDHRPPAVN